MELDEIDPAAWELLEAATDEYIERNDARLDAAASALIEDITVRRPYSITREHLGASFCYVALGISRLRIAVFRHECSSHCSHCLAFHAALFPFKATVFRLFPELYLATLL